jgi:hypothetical protein
MVRRGLALAPFKLVYQLDDRCVQRRSGAVLPGAVDDRAVDHVDLTRPDLASRWI